MKIFIIIINFLIAVLLNFSLSGEGVAQSWTVVPSPSPDTGRNVLRGVGAISSNDVWAVGAYGQLNNSVNFVTLKRP